jgi:hypothetical protein
MSQHNLVIDNVAGAAVRAALNLALPALASLSSGEAEPATPYPFQFWADAGAGSPTPAGALRRRNAGNSLWLPYRPLANSPYATFSGNATALPEHHGRLLDFSAAATLTLAAAATLGEGWWCWAKDSATTGLLTVTPQSGEYIDDRVSFVLVPGASCKIVCDGVEFRALYGKRPSLLAFSTAGDFGAGSATWYLGHGFKSSALENAQGPITCKGVLHRLYVYNRSNPVSGGGSPTPTVTYAVLVNGAPAAITCSQSYPNGSSSQSDLSNVVPVVAGDLVCLRRISEGGVGYAANAELGFGRRKKMENKTTQIVAGAALRSRTALRIIIGLAASLALVHAASAQNPNYASNRLFQRWGAGTSFSACTVGVHTADHWYVGPGYNGCVAIDRAAIPPHTAVAGSALRIQWTAAPTQGEAQYFPGFRWTFLEHQIPNVEVLAGRTVEFRFCARVAAAPPTVIPIVWQNFSNGDYVIHSGPVIALTPDWVCYATEFRLLPMDGRTLDVSNYTGIGLDWLGQQGPTIEIGEMSLRVVKDWEP